MTLRQLAIEIVTTLTDAGYIAYFAGGCVRDSLLGLSPKDYDVATSARPDQVRAVFGRRKTIAIGESFGVITVLGPNKLQTEVATFRRDGVYTDGRHPDEIAFSSPKEDAARRDFTINGMFYDPRDDRVIDYVGGRADLRARCVRAIGDPHQRFSEDRLRMLRAVRFAATYDFQIERATAAAIQSHFEAIGSVSQERITQELQRMLCHQHRRRALELLVESKLIDIVLPCVVPITLQSERWPQVLDILDALPRPNLAVVLAALLGSTAAGMNADRAGEVCRRLRVSNETRKTVEWILEHEARLRSADALTFAELQPLLVDPRVQGTLDLLDARARVDGGSLAPVEHCRRLLQLPTAELDPEPLIRGDDLRQLGVPSGPEYKQLLSLVRTAQLNGQINSREAALELIRHELPPPAQP